MQICKALNTEVLHNKEFRMGSVVVQLDNKMILVCNKFNHSRKYNLELIVWLSTEKKWVRAYAKNEYTEIMWGYYCKHQQKRSHDFRKCENMIRHERKHKGGGGESRIYNGDITDYECSKNPLHDFRRCYNWNEGVTMNRETKRKFNANIKALNRDLMEISEGKLQDNELIKTQFKAIRVLIDDCENLALNKEH